MIEQRLIDVNRLSQEMCQRFPFPNGAVADDVMAIINNAPTVDAVPVVRGKWVKDEDNDVGTCSVCKVSGEWVHFGGSGLYSASPSYCPSCGTKMEEEE